ncbi:paraquat-inducible protein A [Thiogranum longum]|uniref:Paraquat-inducible protein A n=1 Tax=Thiogranum longum TaxID=1537524 RepID=A0A4V2PH17_9GAMM|nr:paraquat-inducible protein A [Thiogranum longum]TCK18966.1 paraquat-inducible protein A [Thiogranum longum]
MPDSGAGRGRARELVACHQCDELQCIGMLAPGQSAHCYRCGALLARNPAGGLLLPIVLNMSALLLMLLAYFLPFLTLEIQGRSQQTTLPGTAKALYDAGMGETGIVVLLTTVVGPILLVTGSLYVLLSVQLYKPLPGLRHIMVWIGHVLPWGMLDVFMVGVLVAAVKLSDMANLVVGPALYAYVALIVVSTAALSQFEPHIIWARMDRMGVWYRAR